MDTEGRQIIRFASTIRDILRAHARVILPLAAVVAVGLVALVAVLVVYAQLIGPAVFAQVAEASTSFASLTLVVGLAMTPLLLLVLAASLVWAGIAVLMADGALVGRRVSAARASLVAARRLPRAAGVVAVWFAATLAAIVLTPVHVVAGLLGLALAPLARRSRIGAAWPSTRQLLVLSIPFSLAFLVAVRWSLALPVTWIDAAGVRDSLRRSEQSVTGRTGHVAAVLAIVIVTTVALTEGLVLALGPVALDVYAELAVRVGTLILVGPLVFVALTVLLRRTAEVADPADAALRPVAGSALSRIAALVIATLIIPTSIVIGAPMPAIAATGTQPVEVVIETPSTVVEANVDVMLTIRVASPFGAEGVQPTGFVDISVDGVALPGTYEVISSGFGSTYDLTRSFTPGEHLIEVSYPGDDLYESAVGELTFTAASTTVTALGFSPSSPVFGDTVSLTATVTSTGATPGGTVEFFRSSGGFVSLGSAPVNGAGVATLEVATLPTGSSTLVASYTASTTHLDSQSDAASITVAEATTTTSFTITPTSFTITPTSPSDAGASLSAAVTVSNDTGTAAPRGSIELQRAGGGVLGTETLVNGATSITFTLPPGSYGVTAYFVPETGFASSSSTESHSVSNYASTVSLGTSGPTTVSGETVDLTATITAGPTPTGTVGFSAQPASGTAISLGSAAVALDGTASLSVSTLPVGSYTFVATYSGNATTVGDSSAPVAHTVSKAVATLDVAPATLTPTFGDTLQVVVTVSSSPPASGRPTGTVTILRDGVELDSSGLAYESATSSTATFTVPVGDAGPRELTVDYSGDDDFATGDAGVSLTVAKLATSINAFGPFDRSHVYGEAQTYDGAIITDADAVPTGTVQLWVAGARVATGELADSAYAITTDLIDVGPSLNNEVWVVYLGDDNHEGSTNRTTDPFSTLNVEMVKASGVPVLTISPSDPGLGGTATLTATLDDVGAGPTGLVEFFSIADGVLGSAPVLDGVATLDVTVTETTTFYSASYAGDDNFSTGDSATERLDVTRAAAIVTLSDPGVREWGEAFDLTITVTIGDGSAASTVDLVSIGVSTTTTVVSNAPLSDFGSLTLTACVGHTAVCPDGAVLLPLRDQMLEARYGATAVNFAGASDPVDFRPVAASTEIALGVTPNPAPMGTGMYLRADVSSILSPAIPTGEVSFFARTPLDVGGTAEVFLERVAVVDGVALLTTRVGGGANDVRWPADAIVARFWPAALSGVAPSVATEPLTINRHGVSVTVSAPPPTVFAATEVQVTLIADPGFAADFLGQIVVTSDTGETCSTSVPSGVRFASCTLTWTSVGAHSYTATYSGDITHESASSATTSVTVGQAAPTLSPSAPGQVDVGETVTVTWNTLSATASGDVTVYGGSELWCVVDISVGECSGSFSTAAPASNPAIIRVQYAGDETWTSVEVERPIIVVGCYALDVTSSSPASRGTVRVDTPSNCGVDGYLAGTEITVTAEPIAPNVFVQWEKFDETSPNLVLASTELSTSFVITDEYFTRVHVASFALECFAITSQATGNGALTVLPDSNCTRLDGSAGWEWGTAVQAYPRPSLNSLYDENDLFYRFGQPSAGVVARDSFGTPRVVATITAPLSIPIEFGPRCRAVSVLADPADAGDAGTVVTEENCSSPQKTGFLRGSEVAVSMTPGDPTLVLSGWEVDGALQPDLGRQTSPTITVGVTDPVVTGIYVSCFSLDVEVDGAYSFGSRPVGEVLVDVEPDCIDGSARYAQGTAVTLTPVLNVETGYFSGWNGERLEATPAEGTGPLPEQALVVTLNADTTVVAGFYLAEACSLLNVIDRENLLEFSNTGCGEGYYFDRQKQLASVLGGDPRDYWQTSDRSYLQMRVRPDVPLDVYVTVRGDQRECFGRLDSSGGPTADLNVPKTYGPLGRSALECAVGGRVVVKTEACQTVYSVASLFVEGDESGRAYSTGSLPASLNLRAPDGSIGTFGMGGFDWVQAIGVTVDDDALGYEPINAGPCAEAGNAFPPNTDIALYGMGPGDGFAFRGFTNLVDGLPLLEVNPALVTTSGDQRSFAVRAAYSIACHSLSLGRGISIIGDPARCPGSTVEENRFIAGTAVQVRASYASGDKKVVNFDGGVVGNQITVSSTTGDLAGWAWMDGDKRVTADYVTTAERVARGVVQGLKISAGVFAVAAPIALGMLFPPAGIFFALLGAGAGIASLIPGGDGAAAAFDLVNPTKIMVCAAQWSFNNDGDPTGNANVGAVAGTANTVRQIANGSDVITKPIADLRSLPFGVGGKLPSGLANVPGGLSFALGAASFGYGLYSAGIADTDLNPQTIDELRSTSTMTSCLDEQWRAADANTSGD